MIRKSNFRRFGLKTTIEKEVISGLLQTGMDGLMENVCIKRQLDGQLEHYQQYTIKMSSIVDIAIKNQTQTILSVV